MALALPSSFSRRLLGRWLATPLAIWGKLPSHADFLRHGVKPEQARDWQDWVARVWSQRPVSLPAPRPRRLLRRAHAEPDWMTLEPRSVHTDLTEVPVAFVMPPGVLGFSPKHCVQGVLLASEDQVGRPCPLIIFQQVAPVWLHRNWSDKPQDIRYDMLYWLSRVAARTHAANRGWSDLTGVVDAIWQVHAPGWKHLLGTPMEAPEPYRLKSLLRQFCADESLDVARGLQGVQRTPWVRGPTHMLRDDKPAQAFWQQDLHGGYIKSGASLPALWGTQA